MDEKLKIKEIYECLLAHQSWRMGDIEEQPLTPKALTLVINEALGLLESIVYIEREIDFIKKNSDYYDANFFESESYHKGFYDAIQQIKDVVEARR